MLSQVNQMSAYVQKLPTVPQAVFLVFLGSLLLTVSSYISVPMIPVPITMQTLAVTTIGALYGWRLGMATVIVWLMQGALGLPVFANGAGGLPHLLGPTAGYLFAFPVAAAATGFLAERGWNGDRAGLAFSAMLIGNLICLACGALWLSSFMGIHQAIAAGFAPFTIGALIKSGMGVAVLKLRRA